MKLYKIDLIIYFKPIKFLKFKKIGRKLNSLFIYLYF